MSTVKNTSKVFHRKTACDSDRFWNSTQAPEPDQEILEILNEQAVKDSVSAEDVTNHGSTVLTNHGQAGIKVFFEDRVHLFESKFTEMTMTGSHCSGSKISVTMKNSYRTLISQVHTVVRPCGGKTFI